MAPKTMKRPAAKAASPPAKKRGGPSQTPKIDSEVQAKCEAVAGAIMEHEPLPLSVRHMLCAMIKDSLPIMKDSRHRMQHNVVEMVAETLYDIETKYKKEIELYQETVDNADANKAALAQAEKESEEEFQRLKATTAAAKEPAEADVKSMWDAKAALSKSKSDQTAGDRQITELEEKKAKLDSTLKDVFLPLKESKASGREGKNQLKVIEKVGKEFMFDPSMLDAVVTVLAKEPAERGTFDKMVEKQLEETFVKGSEALAVSIADLMPGKKERADLVAEMEAASTACEEKAKASKAELDTARTAESLGLHKLNENLRKVSNFMPELKKASDALDAAKAALVAFQTGPLQGFVDLKERCSGPMPPGPRPQQNWTEGPWEANPTPGPIPSRGLRLTLVCD